MLFGNLPTFGLQAAGHLFYINYDHRSRPCTCRCAAVIMRHSSHHMVYTNARMVYWLNANDLELLGHNINNAASVIPGLNKYLLLLFIYVVTYILGWEVRVLDS